MSELTEVVEEMSEAATEGFGPAQSASATADKFIQQYGNFIEESFNKEGGPFQKAFGEMFENVTFKFDPETYTICAGECSEGLSVEMSEFSGLEAPFNLATGEVTDLTSILKKLGATDEQIAAQKQVFADFKASNDATTFSKICKRFKQGAESVRSLCSRGVTTATNAADEAAQGQLSKLIDDGKNVPEAERQATRTAAADLERVRIESADRKAELSWTKKTTVMKYLTGAVVVGTALYAVDYIANNNPIKDFEDMVHEYMNARNGCWLVTSDTGKAGESADLVKCKILPLTCWEKSRMQPKPQTGKSGDTVYPLASGFPICTICGGTATSANKNSSNQFPGCVQGNKKNGAFLLARTLKHDPQNLFPGEHQGATFAGGDPINSSIKFANVLGEQLTEQQLCPAGTKDKGNFCSNYCKPKYWPGIQKGQQMTCVNGGFWETVNDMCNNCLDKSPGDLIGSIFKDVMMIAGCILALVVVVGILKKFAEHLGSS